jgi:FAD synthase
MVRLLDDIDHIPPGSRFVATVGVFDGVHLGHLHVLRALSGLALDRGAVPIAVTFEPHPQAVVTGRTPELICDPDEKLARMGAGGAELVVVQRFDEAFRAQTAEEFLERLARGRDLAGLVMSPESAFGRDRQGTVDTVRRLAIRHGWQLVEIDTLEMDGARVSSGRIRELVAAGDLDAAAHLLGRRYAITGSAVAAGDAWWALEPATPYAMPPAGSYAIKASWDPDPGPDDAVVFTPAPWMPSTLLADLEQQAQQLDPTDDAVMERLRAEALTRYAAAVDRDPTRALASDPLDPGVLEVGLGRLDDAGRWSMSLAGAPVPPGSGRVRMQLVERSDAAVAAADDACLLAALSRAREGQVVIRFDFEESWPEPGGGWRLPTGPVPPDDQVGWTAQAGPVGALDDPVIERTWYSGWWSLEGEPAGLGQVDIPTWETLGEAVAWARARARRVIVELPDTWPPATREDGQRWTGYTAGEDPIPDRPVWDGWEP